MAKKPIDKPEPPSEAKAAAAIAPADPVKLSLPQSVPLTMAGTPEKPYVVLARKYRPKDFTDMIGQDPLVQTLRNAFASGRIAQGYMLTGVRGIGKTTTARILARGLNYEPAGGDLTAKGRATVDMPELGRHCREIMESRHPDVIELDAASNTGIDDIREIIENARYKPIAARYKVFIIDEVHMLSKNAFNGLLKTLEEPPEHVKFVFATTEIRKVPITILSRCQRFDLRRVDVPVLIRHCQRILASEGASAEEDALRLIARAAEGSVRDGLSILDQAIAMGSGEVKAADVRAMLGLADRSRIFDLLELVFGAKPGPAIQALAKLHRDGAEPLQVLADLGEAVHLVTRTKIVGAEAAGESLSAEERARSASLAGQLSVPILARAWQMLVKGLEEAGKAGNPLAAAEMVLIRLAYTADLPSPDELIRSLGGVPTKAGVTTPNAPPKDSAVPRGPLNASGAAPAMTDHEPPPVASYEDYGNFGPEADFAPSEDDDQAEIEADIGPALQPTAGPAVVRTFAEVVELASRRRDARLKVMLEENVSLVRFDAEQGLIDVHLLANAPKELGNELREKLNAWTDRKWMVALAPRPGEPAIGQVQRDQAARELEQLKAHPAVAEVIRQFPQAKITNVKILPRAKVDESQAG